MKRRIVLRSFVQRASFFSTTTVSCGRPGAATWRAWFVWLVLAILCAGCGSGSASSVPGITPPATYQTLKPAYNYSQTQTIAGLFIKLDGFFCTAGPFLRNLTIASKQLSYDVGTAETLHNYLQYIEGHALTANDTGLVTGWSPPEPPRELQWVAGGTKCTGTLAITNMRSTNVGIKGFGFQLTAPTVANTTAYRRVSLKGDCPECGGGPLCIYTSTVTLQQGQVDTHFDHPLAGKGGMSQCPVPLIMAPGDSFEIVVTLLDAKKRDLIYTGTPELQMVGEPTISLSAFATRLVFTHTDMFPCYQLQGLAFVSCPDEG